MLGPWIAIVCVILGALGFGLGIVNANPVMFVAGVLFMVGAAIGGAKGSFVQHHDAGHH